MRERVKTIISYGMPALIVLAVMSIVLLVQGIWPFGSETVDFYDMGQQVASEYLQIYDEIHFSRSIIYDWYTCLSRGIPGGTYIAPLNLLYYFIPRNMILESFSIMLVVKMMGMALTMRILLKKEMADCPDFFSIILSAGYGLCGYAFMMYTIIAWLDLAILIPLLLMYTQRLLRDGKMLGYIVCISLLLIESFYVPAMVLIFVFIMTGIYLVARYFDRKRSATGEWQVNQTPYILRLGIATLTALALSAWVWIPKVFSAGSSMRFENEAEAGIVAQYVKILTHVQPDYATRWWCLLGASFAASVSFLGIIRDLKNKNIKRLIFVIGGIGCLMLQLVFENIQLMWHLGSYVNYPVRNGFLMYLIFALTAAMYLPQIYSPDEEKSMSVYIPMGGIIVMVLLCGIGIFWYDTSAGMSVYTVFRASALCAMSTFVIYLFLLLFKSGRYAKLSVFVVCAELIFYGVMLIGKPLYVTGYAEETEQEAEYIRIAHQLDDAMNITSSRLDRIKNPDTSLNTNYGNVLNRATLTGWPSSLSADVIKSAYKMGNSIQYTRILDAGGNAFTDALMHTTQAVSMIDLDEGLYDKIDSAYAVVDHNTGEQRLYSLYNCRYVLPFGCVARDINSLYAIERASNTVEFTNAAYKAISVRDEDIVKRIDALTLDADLAIEISGNKLLYFTANCGDAEQGNIRIYVNGSAVAVPTIKELDNVYYPVHFNNNCLLLGDFKNETVHVRIERNEEIEAPDWDLMLYELDVDMLGKLCNEYVGGQPDISFSAGTRSLQGYVNAKSGEYLILPMEYDSSWAVRVNSQEVSPVRVTGLLTAVPLSDGDNYVEMKYFPQTMKIGNSISLIALVSTVVIAALFSIGCGKRRAFNGIIAGYDAFENRTRKGICVLYAAAFAVLLVGMYIIPVIYGVYYYAKMLIG